MIKKLMEILIEVKEILDKDGKHSVCVSKIQAALAITIEMQEVKNKLKN